MIEPDRPAGRRLDLAVGVISFTIALALLAAVLSSLQTTEHAIEAVDRGAAASLARRVQDELRQARRPPTQEELQAVLRALEPEGLYYIALQPPGGRPALEAGAAALPEGGPGELVREGGRARISMPLPPPPGAPGAPLGRLESPRGPLLTLELSSALSASLVLDAQRSAWAGALAGALLLLAGPAIVLLLRRGRRLEAERIEGAQLAALGRMSAVIAHEIKNPLASLKGHAQLLAERLDDPRDLKKAGRVVDEAKRLEHLVRGLLEFLRSRRIEPRAADPVALVRAAIEELGAEGRARLDARAAPERWTLDPDRIRQALTNLVGNALEASEGEVEVEVTASRSRLSITISDRGPGLPPDQDVFEPFVTTKTHGTGLGLTVARAIVEAHGGTLRAEPRAGGGTVARVELPVAPSAAG